MKRITMLAVVAVALLVTVLVVRGSRFTTRQVSVEPGALVSVDTAAATERFAGALRIATEPGPPSGQNSPSFAPGSFCLSLRAQPGSAPAA